jgi:hypothetical protein
VDEAGRPLGEYSPNSRIRFNEAALVFGLDYILQPATFINRKYLAAVSYLTPNLKYGLDYDLWVRLARRSAPVAVGEYLAASREYATTKTAAGGFERAEELRLIAQSHSGVPLTPGALAYFLYTVQGQVAQQPQVYPPSFLLEVQKLSRATANLFAAYGAGPDGFPLDPDQLSELSSNTPRSNVLPTALEQLRKRFAFSEILRRVARTRFPTRLLSWIVATIWRSLRPRDQSDHAKT